MTIIMYGIVLLLKMMNEQILQKLHNFSIIFHSSLRYHKLKWLFISNILIKENILLMTLPKCILKSLFPIIGH